MYAREINLGEYTRMLVNRNNPKTMDYFYFRIMRLSTDDAEVAYLNSGGEFTTRLQNRPEYLKDGAAYGDISDENSEIGNFNLKVQRSRRDGVGVDVYFLMHLFAHQLLPKSRDFKLLYKAKAKAAIVNPKAGQPFHVRAPNGTILYTILESAISKPEKYWCLYQRNNWERMNAIKIKDENFNKDS